LEDTLGPCVTEEGRTVSFPAKEAAAISPQWMREAISSIVLVSPFTHTT
jgi:hypothetical protein